MHFPRPRGLLAALLAATTPLSARGQSPRVTGVSVERFYFEDYRFITVNYRRTDLREKNAGAGLDLALGIVPTALAPTRVVLQVDAGLARALPLESATVTLRGGLSNFLALGRQSEFLPGFQGGIAAIVPLEKRARLRVDLTRHFYFPGGQVAMWSIALGLSAVSP